MAESSPDAPTTDREALARLERFGGAKLLGEMVTLFLAGAPQRIGSAREAVQRGDAAAAELALHSLKSSAAQLGAVRLQQLSERGERAARAGTLDEVDALLPHLDEEFGHVRTWLADATQPGHA